MPTETSTAPQASRPSLNQPRSRTDLFVSFTLLALQGFGGVVAVVQRELVERKRWMTREQFVEDWAVAHVMPGPSVVNLSMMIGGRYFGLGGALAAMAGMLAIPLVIVLLLAALYSGVADTAVAQGALRGVGAVAAGLVAATGLKLTGALAKNAMGLGICIALAVLTFVAIAVLRWPLAWVLPGIGVPACLWAWTRLAATDGNHAEKQT